jgi:predicted metal-dependent hydrolase
VSQASCSRNDSSAKIASALDRWYRREAGSTIESVVERQAARLGSARLGSARLGSHSTTRASPSATKKTRWGSCSRKDNLSFSWRLVIAPPEVLEYVVVHELLHLREPNHSKAFWRLLEAARPCWQEQARWLREHGQEPHDYVAASAHA